VNGGKTSEVPIGTDAARRPVLRDGICIAGSGGASSAEKDPRGNAKAPTDGKGSYVTSVPDLAAGDTAPRPVARRVGDPGSRQRARWMSP
jgi:hypothetical protein